MTTRAEYILSLCNENGMDLKTAADTLANQRLDPHNMRMVPAFAGGAAALTLGINAAQIHGLNKARNTKISQTGVGSEYTQARANLSSLRKQNIKSLGLRPSISAKIQAQKSNIRDIQNRGLHQYHMGQQTVPPPVTRPQ